MASILRNILSILYNNVDNPTFREKYEYDVFVIQPVINNQSDSDFITNMPVTVLEFTTRLISMCKDEKLLHKLCKTYPNIFEGKMIVPKKPKAQKMDNHLSKRFNGNKGADMCAEMHSNEKKKSSKNKFSMKKERMIEHLRNHECIKKLNKILPQDKKVSHFTYYLDSKTQEREIVWECELYRRELMDKNESIKMEIDRKVNLNLEGYKLILEKRNHSKEEIDAKYEERRKNFAVPLYESSSILPPNQIDVLIEVRREELRKTLFTNIGHKRSVKVLTLLREGLKRQVMIISDREVTKIYDEYRGNCGDNFHEMCIAQHRAKLKKLLGKIKKSNLTEREKFIHNLFKEEISHQDPPPSDGDIKILYGKYRENCGDYFYGLNSSREKDRIREFLEKEFREYEMIEDITLNKEGDRKMKML